ncbi:hypothetical protein AAVH_38674, partial [Aphelenchoides avenae]
QLRILVERERRKQQKRIPQRPKAAHPARVARKPVLRARRGSSTTAAHSKPAERPKAVRQLAPKKHGRTTSRPPSAKDPCAHRKCKNPYENEKLVPDGDEIAWIECDRCSKWYHCVCVLGRNKPPRTTNKFLCKAAGCI